MIDSITGFGMHQPVVHPPQGWRDHGEKKGKEGGEERRGWSGLLLHGGMDAAYGSQYYSNIVSSIVENHYDAKNASLRLVAMT
jgi:hypothetical protein